MRRSARRHGIRSEASYRFERGVDPEGVRRAADRAARLLAELAGGEVAEGTVEARGEPAPRAPEIELELARANRLLGTSFSAAQAVALLARVEVAARETKPGTLRCRPPSHRGDLRIAEDLAEELVRIHGVDKIAATLPGRDTRAGQPAAALVAGRAGPGRAGRRGPVRVRELSVRARAATRSCSASRPGIPGAARFASSIR